MGIPTFTIPKEMGISTSTIPRGMVNGIRHIYARYDGKSLRLPKSLTFDTNWYFEGHLIPEAFGLKIKKRYDEKRRKTEWFIRDCLIPRLYNPNTKAGQRRMEENYQEFLKLLT